MKHNRCYICYQPIEGKHPFHPACNKKLFGITELPKLNFNSKEIEDLALKLIRQKRGIPGIQKKLSLSLQNTSHKNYKRLTIVGYLGGDYILKLPATEYPYIVEIEDLVMHLATIAKLNVAQHALLPMEDGSLAYITKRFDRDGKNKIAVEDLCQLSHKLTEDKYKSSYERVGNLIRYYATKPGNEILNFFELLLFCYITGNADMHLKNFSLMTEDHANIKLSPFYDLISTRLLLSSKIDPEETALSLNGKKQNIRKKDFIELGNYLNIPKKVIDNSIHSMSSHLVAWEQTIQNSFVNEITQERLYQLIKARLAILL